MDAARHHATSILALLHAHAYLLTHLNDFFVCRCWRDVPFEWRAFLLSLSADELAALPSMTHPVPGAPASLVSFISLAASLALRESASSTLVRLFAQDRRAEAETFAARTLQLALACGVHTHAHAHAHTQGVRPERQDTSFARAPLARSPGEVPPDQSTVASGHRIPAHSLVSRLPGLNEIRFE